MQWIKLGFETSVNKKPIQIFKIFLSRLLTLVLITIFISIGFSVFGLWDKYF